VSGTANLRLLCFSMNTSNSFAGTRLLLVLARANRFGALSETPSSLWAGTPNIPRVVSTTKPRCITH
jgi:hypothetical protein